MPGSRKIKLHGFNNLTKSLSFNIYDICYTASRSQRREYIEYIDEEYNSSRLRNILTNVAKIIKARILSTSHQDYDPLGASVTMLISEEAGKYKLFSNRESPGPLPDGMAFHLDKSHMAVHTYPESHPNTEISTFRVDIDVSTCGRISPLKALNYLVESFDSDIVIMDYRVRGFTRDLKGKKQYMDHKINSIQNYLSKKTKQLYQLVDVNVFQENIFHTKMLIKQFDLDNYLFGIEKTDLSQQQNREIIQKLEKEMLEIFYGRNV